MTRDILTGYQVGAQLSLPLPYYNSKLLNGTPSYSWAGGFSTAALGAVSFKCSRTETYLVMINQPIHAVS